MEHEHHPARRAILLGAGVLLLVLLVSGSALALHVYRAIDYPDAAMMSHQVRAHLRGRPTLRQDASYRTLDDFPTVYNWYAQQFDLGPESRALSQCILIEAATSGMLLRRHISVMLCDTSTDRMIFVERTFSLR